MTYKMIAWDGVSFEVPATFEISGIDKKYLQLDDGDKPCIELRWFDAGSSYKEKNFFRQLTKKVESSSGVKIESTVMPSGWKKALEKYEPTAFYWQSDLSMGRGVMFHCPRTSQVALAQFFGKDGEKLDKAAVKLFETFAFHCKDNSIPWKVYDMNASLPGSFKLDFFEFKPGKFNITVSDEQETIGLYRFSPADTILEQKSLGEFAREMFKAQIKSLNLSIAEFQFESGSTCIFGQDREPSGAAKALSKISSRKRPFGRIEIRYENSSSRILAVFIKSRLPIPADKTQSVFENYGIVS